MHFQIVKNEKSHPYPVLTFDCGQAEITHFYLRFWPSVYKDSELICPTVITEFKPLLSLLN